MRALDGPAAGYSASLRRCPTYLRLVSGGTQGVLFGGDRWDALDLPTDAPAPDELVHVYKAVPGTHGVVFVRPGGRFEHADYRHVEIPDPLREVLRDRDHFLAWAVLHHASQTERVTDGLPVVVYADLAKLTPERFAALAPAVGGEEVGLGCWRLGAFRP